MFLKLTLKMFINIKNKKKKKKIIYLCIGNYDYIDLVHLYLLMK